MPMPDRLAVMPDEAKELFRQLWLDGVSFSVMARRFKCSSSAIRSWGARLGCPPRSNKPQNRGQFDMKEAAIYSAAAKIRDTWPAWRTPKYAMMSKKSHARLRRIAAAVQTHDKPEDVSDD